MSKRFSLFIPVLLLGCSPSDDSVRTELAIKAFNEAKEHVEAASATMSRDEAFAPKIAARALVTHAIESGGLDGENLAEAYALRASIHHSLGSYPLNEDLMREAVSDSDSAIDLDPTNLTHYYRRAMAYEFLGQHDRAIEDYTYVLQREPNSIGTQGARGHLLFEIGDYDAAITDFTAAIALEPDNMRYVESRGDAYKAIQEHQHAIDDYLKVKAWQKNFRTELFGDSAANGIDPALIETQTKIAMTYEKMGSLDQAINEYKEILEHDPLDAWAGSRLESLESGQGRP